MGGAGNRPKGVDGTLCDQICTTAIKLVIQEKVVIC